MNNNKLIAEFMGWKRGTNEETNTNQFFLAQPDHWYLKDENELEFHTSWDWLMPVVERINDTERYEVCIGNCHCHITDIENDNYKIRALTLSLQGKTTIEATHLAVVEFINWYNNDTI